MTSPNEPQERIEQPSLFPEAEFSDTDVTAQNVRFEDVPAMIAKSVEGKDSRRGLRERDQRISEDRHDENGSVFEPVAQVSPSGSEEDGSDDVSVSSDTTSPKTRRELPDQNQSNWISITEKEADAIWDAMTPEERERQIKAKDEGVASIRQALETKKEAQALEPALPEPSTEEVKPRGSLLRRNAFGRSISLDYYGLKPERIAGIDEEDLTLVEVDGLRIALFNSRGEYSVDGLSLNPSEYEIILRNVQKTGTAIMARTLTANALEQDLDVRTETAVRSRQHAFEAKMATMTEMLEGFKQEQDRLSRLRKEMNTPGYAHMNELTMRGLVASAMGISFQNLLETVAVQEGWDNETLRNAERALLTRLLTGKQQDKVSYWKDLTDLNLLWNHAKQAKTRQRITQTRRS